jgi:heme/copper-type cytochrome/quinol oxidase subunit 2
MNTMTVLVIAGLVATVLALIEGIVSMAHGGASDQARSHMLMFRRVGWQAITVLILLLILFYQVR